MHVRFPSTRLDLQIQLQFADVQLRVLSLLLHILISYAELIVM